MHLTLTAPAGYVLDPQIEPKPPAINHLVDTSPIPGLMPRRARLPGVFGSRWTISGHQAGRASHPAPVSPQEGKGNAQDNPHARRRGRRGGGDQRNRAGYGQHRRGRLAENSEVSLRIGQQGIHYFCQERIGNSVWASVRNVVALLAVNSR